MAETAIRAHFERQAGFGDDLGSPFMGVLCRILARDLDSATETGRRVLAWPDDPGTAAVALRLCGGLHSLVLTGADAELAAAYPPNAVDEAALARAVRAAMARHDATLVRWLDGAPQTNEIGRSAMLLPGFLQATRQTGRPFDLLEIGASAGLNLAFDRFYYDYGGSHWGSVDSTVVLTPEVRGGPPPLGGRLDIVRRAGADIAPVDISDPQARLRLRAYVWPDQAARLQRLDAALALAGEHGVPVERADAAEAVRRRLADRLPGTAFVLFHSIMWHYMSAATQSRIAAMLAEAGKAATADAPVAWLRMEGRVPAEAHATLTLTLWPGGEARALAACDYHGRWIAWQG